MRLFTLLILTAFILSCSASNFYKSEWTVKTEIFTTLDSLVIQSKQAQIFIEDSDNGKNEVEFYYLKKKSKAIKVFLTEEESYWAIKDQSGDYAKDDVKIVVKLAAGNRIRLESFGGLIQSHFTGKIDIETDSADIKLFQVRDAFSAKSNTSDISIKLSDTFNHLGNIKSTSGNILVVTGLIDDKLSIQLNKNTFNLKDLPLIQINGDESKVIIKETSAIL